MACMSSVAKLIIVTINVFLLIGSLIMMSFGIAAYVNPEGVATIFHYVLPAGISDELQHAGVDLTKIVTSNAVFMIVVGIAGIVCSGLGCFGACCMIKCMLFFYAALVSCLLLAEIALIIFAATYPNQFKSFIQESMQSTLERFETEMSVNETMNVLMPVGVVEYAWATIQLKERCCGAKNWSDYSTLESWNNAKLVPTSMFDGKAVVPISCCTLKDSDNLKQVPPPFDRFTDLTNCLKGDPRYINQKNCFDAVEGELENFIQDYKGIAIGIATIVAVLEILLIWLTVYLYRTSDRIVYVKYV